MGAQVHSFCRKRGLMAKEPGHPEGGERLATEHLAQAARRLVLLAGVLSGAVLVSLLAGVIMHEVRGLPAPTRLWLDRGRHAGLLTLSLALIAVLRFARPGPQRAMDLGAAYQVLGALVMSISLFGFEPLLQNTPSLLTWLGVWIVLFPMVAPATPTRTVIQALLAAATAPVVFAVATALRGGPWPEVELLVGTFLPYPICAGMALIPALVLGGLSRQIVAAKSQARQLGSYRLVEKLGAGGMGEVWRAEHRLLARPAAVKLIRPPAGANELADANQRFEREARATSRLRSVHTVSLWDYGVVEDGTAYYAMELLEGIDLERLVARHGPVPPGRAIAVIMQAAESLAEAHAVGLIHRDIKPANLFLARLGVSVDVLKVMDFGLVALEERAKKPGDGVKLTNPEWVVGTPAYMAPEQALSGGIADARSDIYGLGCVLYWLLTGTLVFDEESPIRVLMDHARTPPTPLRVRNAAVPADLEAVVMACLSKEPDKRPQSARELRRRLAACADAGQWTEELAQQWWARHLPPERPVEADVEPSRRETR